MQLKYFAADVKRVSRVGPSLVAHNHICLSSQKIGYFSFAFVTPLRPYNYHCRHAITPYHVVVARAITSRAASTPEAEAWARPRVIPAPSPTANRLVILVSRQRLTASLEE
jgi:hypothetical protein